MTVCGYRSDTTARRKARAAPPPAGATATQVRDRTRPATMRPVDRAVEKPGHRTPARGRSRSVDPAHPVDGHLFNQGLGDELGVGVGLLVRLHDVAFRY